MIDVGKWALDNAKLIWFIVVVMIIGGVLSFYNMSKLEDPEIKVKQAMVITTYPGASAYEVELEVTDPLEKSIRSMYDIDNIQSRSMSDLSLITVTLTTTTPEDEIEQHYDILRRKVEAATLLLPEGASTPVVLDDYGDVYGMFYAITAEGFSYDELGDYAELVKREVQDIEGISKVEIYGQLKSCINVELSQDKMAYLGVLPAEVLSTMNGQNSTVYSGYFDAGDLRLRITVDDRYKTPEDIAEMIIQGHEDDQLRLRDIASVYSDYEYPVRNSLYYDGKCAVGLSIAGQQGTDITKLGTAVEKKIAELESGRIPAGIEFEKVFFQPDRVNSAIWKFLTNLLESVLIVVVILMLTMGFRSGVIIGGSLVIIVFGSIMVLGYLNGTLQRVSLASLIIAMGMLVDNAIVIVDGILVDLSRGKPRREALTAIGRKTAIPLFGATLIAILAFLPIFMSPDTAGIYVRDLFIVLAVSLLLSWLLAITHVPIMAQRYLKVKGREDEQERDSNLESQSERGHEVAYEAQSERESGASSEAIESATESADTTFTSRPYAILRKILSWTIYHRKLTALLAILLVIVSIFCYRYIPQEFFPDMSYDQLYIEFKMAEGTSSETVKENLDEITEWLLSREEVTHVTASVGGTPSRYNLVRSIATPSMSYGELIVDFKTQRDLLDNIIELQTTLSENYPAAYVRVKRYNLMYQKYPIELQFSGPDPAILKRLTKEAEEIMERNPKTYLICSDWEPEMPTLVVKYDQPSARNIGLTRSDIGISLLSANEGIPVGTFYEGSRERTIYLKSSDSDGNPIDILENAPIFSAMPPIQNITGESIAALMTGALSEEEFMEELFRTVPLRQATDGIEIVWEDPVVVRYNGERSMRAQCDPVPGESAESARSAIEPEIAAIELPEGYSYMWLGEYKASSESTRYLFKNFPLAIVLMIVILILLFRDFKKPAIIFCCVPLIFVGVVFGMLLSGKAFGFVAIVGVLGLIGMMIKNGVVLMDEISLQLKSGKNPAEALLDSSATRFRPVMMASLTTILGMLPLINDDMFGSLAVTIMAGLFIGTLITLLFIPTLYSLFFHIKIERR